MVIFRYEPHIRIRKFGELRVGDVFFFNELPFIKLDTDYFQNTLCLEDGIQCNFNYNDDVEYQYCGYFRSNSYKEKKNG